MSAQEDLYVIGLHNLRNVSCRKVSRIEMFFASLSLKPHFFERESFLKKLSIVN